VPAKSKLPAVGLPPGLLEILTDHGAVLDDRLADAAARAWQYSTYLRGLLRGRPEVLFEVAADGAAAVSAKAAADARRPGATPAGLRDSKSRAALALALGDLSGALPLEAVTAGLSDLADAAIDAAIRIAIAERVPGAGSDGFFAIGLGKLGSRELNYSSDVDLLLVYDRRRLAVRPNDDVDEAAVRIARRIVDILQQRDSSGYVFRVDLRLRPTPEVMPIAIPLRAAEIYYQSEALAWERAAFIRARTVGGDIACGDMFLAEIAPFVWRRSLDYTAVRDIQDMSLQIRDHFDERQAVGPGYDLKRGRGGIREVEFFAQIHQLIFGGRDHSLRVPATMDALAALAASGRIAVDEAEQLSQAYRLLRTIEHRAQMLEDAQTHIVPKKAAERTQLARLSGYADWPALERALKRIAADVGKRYDALIAEAERDRLPRGGAALAARLKALGAAAPRELASLIGKWRGRPYRALKSDAAQRELEAALPGLATAFAAQRVQRDALHRFDDFLSALPTSIQFFALIQANPWIAEVMARVLDRAPLLAGRLARRPEVLDIMLAREGFAVLPDAEALALQLAGGLERYPALEQKLDEVRRWTAERRFQIGVQLVEGAADPLQAGRDYAKLADAAIAALAPAVAAEFARAHGTVPGGSLAILGLGRYGGGMLTEKSDLDLVYLFTGDHEARSDGDRPLPATTYFNRLCQRLTAALSVNTAAGPLYEVDTRLRPSGAQGLLAVNFATFQRYQQDEAWNWEHMALTRARVVHATPAARVQLEQVIAGVLSRPRDAARLRAEVIEMRGDIAAAHPSSGSWDVKHGSGGLVDLEFIVQYLQLARCEALSHDMEAALAALVSAGALPDDLLDAYRLLTRLLVVLRLVDGADPARLADSSKAMLAAAAKARDFDTLKSVLADARKTVVAAWAQVFGTKRKA
jgi:glutamate-ammonia-ligase adenylyltransferase